MKALGFLEKRKPYSNNCRKQVMVNVIKVGQSYKENHEPKIKIIRWIDTILLKI
jgi:hypothetical protein